MSGLSRCTTSLYHLSHSTAVAKCRDPTDGRKTLAEVTKAVKLQGDRRRARNATGALDLALADADPAERQRLALGSRATPRTARGDRAGHVRTLPSERPAG